MNGEHNFVMDAIRSVFGAIDWILFSILKWAYEIFFDITTLEFFSNETIKNFYSRIQVILGILMVFKLSISILQAIVNPDRASDKNNGFSAIITRVITCLVMLTLLVPINIAKPNNDYEIQLNNNGLLFGTLYSLQERIMSNNTVGRLVLGNSASKSGQDQSKDLKTASIEFTNTILKTFITMNPNKDCSGSTAYNIYQEDNKDTVQKILMMEINSQCDKNYALFYYPIIGGAVAIIFAVIIIGFSIDIAVRALKLAVLRLIAPIPIISYLDPNQEKKGAFGNWVKALTSTYLDLFLRLAIIFFVIFLIKDIRENGIVWADDPSDPIIKALVFIIICLGLFFFAKEAPKFIKDVLGISGASQNIGLASILGGTAMALGGGGLAGFGFGAMNAANSQTDAINQGKSVPLMGAWSSNRDLMANIRSNDKDKRGGIVGSLQDRLNYNVRERNMTRLGMSKKDLASANYAKDLAEERLAEAQERLDFAHQNLMTKGSNATQTDFDVYQSAYRARNLAQAAAEKASKTADKMDKFRAQAGVAKTIEAERTKNYRSDLKVKTGDRYYQYDTNKNLVPVNDSVINDKNIKAQYDSKVNEGTYVKYERAIDKNGNFVDMSSKDASTQVAYKTDIKGNKGTVDDSPFSGSQGTGSPNGHRRL